MDSNEIADVIERAADILESERRGWCQGNYYLNSLNSVCALGAVRLAIVNEENGRLWRFGPTSCGSMYPEKRKEAAVSNALRDHLNQYQPEGELWDGIHDYNDEGGRTKEEVIEVMKATAKDLRNANNSVL